MWRFQLALLASICPASVWAGLRRTSAMKA